MAVITGKTVVKNNYGAMISGAKMYSKLIIPPVTVGGYDNTERLVTSGVGGVVNFTNLQTGAIYDFWRGKSDRLRHRIPDNAVSPYLLPPILGNDNYDVCAGDVAYTPVTSDEDGNSVPITAEFPTKLSLVFTILDSLGLIGIGDKVYSQMYIPPLVYGVTFDNSIREIIATGSGIVKFTNLEPGATYFFWTEKSDRLYYRIPDDITNACAA